MNDDASGDSLPPEPSPRNVSDFEPLQFTCCYCGMDFGSRSLGIHQAKCQETRKRINASSPKALRRSLPQPPPLDLSSAFSKAEHNRQAMELYRETGMFPCNGCGRRFVNVDVLKKHVVGCASPGAKLSIVEVSLLENAKPLGYTCCLCGQEFGSASLPIHMRVCREKWLREESNLPHSLRRGEPPVILGCDQLCEENQLEHNEEAMRLYKEHSMLSCSGCLRRFAGVEQLRKHVKSCKDFLRVHPSKGRPSTSGGSALEDESDEAIRPASPTSLCWMCCFCGLGFGSASLGIHQRVCRERWQRENALLPEGLRRDEMPQPPDPSTLDRDAHNEVASGLHRQLSLLPCLGCDRRFNGLDTLKKHVNGCVDGHKLMGAMLKDPAKVEMEEKEALDRKRLSTYKEKDPLGYTCVYCGQDYGSNSLRIHQQSCIEKWVRENSELPAHLRRKKPPDPPKLDVSSPATKRQHNVEARELFRRMSMLPCARCGRLFANVDQHGKHFVMCERASRQAIARSSSILETSPRRSTDRTSITKSSNETSALSSALASPVSLCRSTKRSSTVGDGSEIVAMPSPLTSPVSPRRSMMRISTARDGSESSALPSPVASPVPLEMSTTRISITGDVSESLPLPSPGTSPVAARRSTLRTSIVQSGSESSALTSPLTSPVPAQRSTVRTSIAKVGSESSASPSPLTLPGPRRRSPTRTSIAEIGTESSMSSPFASPKKKASTRSFLRSSSPPGRLAPAAAAAVAAHEAGLGDVPKLPRRNTARV
eukprot:TRINITY_DN37252_c0_g1_i1.p1 TRINITY_DN37252_c0_g1~~TRINITY_DN37252_c0_g1_i1.p1  ORF type:complete len:812 (+),score=126.85 TRINITY_DN37252_c0_g1_i1:130-2436(+)